MRRKRFDHRYQQRAGGRIACFIVGCKEYSGYTSCKKIVVFAGNDFLYGATGILSIGGRNNDHLTASSLLRIYFDIIRASQGWGRLVFNGKKAAGDVKWHRIKSSIHRIEGWNKGYFRGSIRVDDGKVYRK